MTVVYSLTGMVSTLVQLKILEEQGRYPLDYHYSTSVPF